LNAGIASAGVEAAIILTVNFDLNDPDMDGRVRISELIGNFLYEFREGTPVLAPIAIFDVSGEIAFQLRAYLKILFAKFSFEITPPITLFEFSIPFDREPILATERGDGSLLLNIGPNADARLHGNTDDIDETINVFQEGNDLKVWSKQFGVPQSAAQTYSGNSIVGYGGEYGDTINIDSSVNVPVYLEGQSGDDVITAQGGGGGEISGGDGDDTITGGGGADTIFGNEGNDTLDGAGGNDLIIGDFASISTGLIFAPIGKKDGDDTIIGGADDDVIFGGGGQDTIGGDGDGSPASHAADPEALGTGKDIIFGDGGRIVRDPDDPDNRTLWTIRSTGGIGGEQDTINAHAGMDLVYGGKGDDIIDGGADDDELHGESGFDHISGAGHADTIFGGTEDDVIYGFRVEGGPGDPTTDGNDRIEGDQGLVNDDDMLESTGGSGNDFIRGNRGDDTILGGRGTDIIFGDEDGDTIFGESDNDYIFGGPGSDPSIEGGTGNDIIFGDDGLVVFFNFGSLTFADSFVGRPGHEIVGNHRLIGDVSLDPLDPMIADNDGNFRTFDLIVTIVTPTDGNDFVIGGEGDDIVLGGAGNDEIFGDFDPSQPPEGPIPADKDILIGDAGRIQFRHRLRELITTVVGNIAGNDELSGNGNEDVLLGGGADDTLFGRMDPSFTDPALEEDPQVIDDDIIIGDDGMVEYLVNVPDLVSVLDKISTIFTFVAPDPDPADTGGIDIAKGNKGDDIIFGGFQSDKSMDGSTGLTGATGEDIIIGDQGVVDYEPFNGDTESEIVLIYSNDPDNTYGGIDVIIGGADGDTITGDDDDDIVIGDAGEVIYNDAIGTDPFRPNLDFVRTKDYLVGGDDTISGGGDKDIVLGGSFADTIFGDADLSGNPIPGDTPDEDVLIGDEGILRFDGVLTGTISTSGVGFDPALDTDPFSLDVITTKRPDLGSDDFIFGNENDDVAMGGTGIDGIVGDDGLVLTSRNDLMAEPLYGIDALNPEQGTVKPNETVDTKALNAEITSPGDIQRAIINIGNELVKSVELFAFRTDDLAGRTTGGFDDSLRFNDIIFGGQQNDFIHAGAGDDAVSFASAVVLGELSAFEHLGPHSAVELVKTHLGEQSVNVGIYGAEPFRR